MRNPFSHNNTLVTAELLSSSLYDQDNFYDAFLNDLQHTKQEVIIESPFITSSRTTQIMPTLLQLRRKKVRVIINTRNPEEHNGTYRRQAAVAIEAMQSFGVTVLYTAGHHRKLAIIDQTILWEGSLNILSYNDSCEVMRRIVSE